MTERKINTYIGNTDVAVYFDYYPVDIDCNLPEIVIINAIYNLEKKDIKLELPEQSIKDIETECFEYIDLENDWLRE